MPMPNGDLAALAGSWRLLSATAIFSDNGEQIDTFGVDPSGRMVLTPSGRIMFLIVASNRRKATNDAELAALFTHMISYTGTVRAAGPGRFITTVDIARDPAEIGEERLRLFSIEGDRLTIRLPEQKSRFAGGRMGTSELIWERD